MVDLLMFYPCFPVLNIGIGTKGVKYIIPFTKGFDTRDLKEAKALLEGLA